MPCIRFPWLYCDRKYISETGRKLVTRLKEHKADVDKVDTNLRLVKGLYHMI